MNNPEMQDFEKKRSITWQQDCANLCKQGAELYAQRGRPIRFDVLNDVEKQDIENTMKALYPDVPIRFTYSEELPEQAM